MGQDVFVISPEESDDLSNFASFNPLEEIDKETEIRDAMTISLLLLDRIYSSSTTTSAMQNVAAQTLASYIVISKHTMENPNLFSVLQLVRESDALERLNFNCESKEIGFFVKKAHDELLTLPTKDIEFVFKMVINSLKFIESLGCKKATEKSDFMVSDLLDSSKPISVFLKIGIGESEYSPFLQIMLYQIMDRGLKSKGDNNLLVLLDEFTSVATPKIMQKIFLSNLEQLPQHGIKTAVIIHELHQLEKIFGINSKVFLNCFSQLLFFSSTSPHHNKEGISIVSWEKFKEPFIMKIFNKSSRELEKAIRDKDINRVIYFLGPNNILRVNNKSASILKKIKFYEMKILKNNS